MGKNYVIMKSGKMFIGFFYGMFQGNILIFNLGWDQDVKNMKLYDDVCEIQCWLKVEGIVFFVEVDVFMIGLVYIMLVDLDGNQIFIDQYW